MEQITLPTKKQINNLEVLKKFGITATATDFDMMQYGYIKTGGEYWTKTKYHKDSPYVINVGRTGSFVCSGADWFYPGVRPIIKLSAIKGQYKKINDDIIEYGEYPQNIVNKSLKEKLEKLYQNNNLSKTNKKYTSMQTKDKETYEEYLYKENKYIRVKAKIISNDYKFKNKENAVFGETYWVKIEPIKWLVDKREDIAISKEVLTNMPFSHRSDNRYEKSDIKDFLENYFIKEIQIKKTQNIDINKIDDLLSLMDMLHKEKPKVKKNNI